MDRFLSSGDSALILDLASFCSSSNSSSPLQWASSTTKDDCNATSSSSICCIEKQSPGPLKPENTDLGLRLVGFESRRCRSFVCDVCGVRYSHAKTPRDHKQSKHEGRRYKCLVPGCNITVAHQKNLRRHMERRHGSYGMNSPTFMQPKPDLLDYTPKTNSVSFLLE